GHLEEAASIGELLDRIATVTEDPFLAVDVADGGAGLGGVGEPAVERDQPGLGPQPSDVYGDLTFTADLCRESDLLVFEPEDGFGHHNPFLSTAFGAGGLDDPLGLLVGDLLVVIEPDFERSAARGHGPQIDRVPLDFGHGYVGLDLADAAVRVDPEDARSFGVDVAHDIPRVLLGNTDGQVLVRLEQDRFQVGCRRLDRLDAGHPERELVGVDRVVLAVDELGGDVDHRVAGE